MHGILRRVVGVVLPLFLLFTGVASAGGKKPHPEGRDHELSADDRAWVERVQRATNDARKKLKAAHDEALQDEKVRDLLRELRVAMEEEMIHLDPDAEPIIRERYEVFQEILRYQTEDPVSQENAERVNELTVRYHELDQKLGKLPEQAAESEQVKPKREAYQEALLEKMTEINSKVPDLIALEKKLVKEFQDYRQQMLERHGTAEADGE